ncbi:metal-dependent hydrolase [Pseudosulfitobacter pseudonitzschiae]|uniref:metal-dependent hydrolase n=1 Tax=Pseudosulfitobacter pseudonitzschiae TaxID=1402135 RepID=UPI001AF77314|nr:metal-dependent hydrolase [Pseudosulfitobacter pseudonitzschiae]MBM1816577.1 metal-dependent hydrolase [Pseudosulfitobacter pseudonitzschiae]MBM1833175.1 metal-dependent hydrolase [Pseudosulfitobacter pseudonitzschiae]MBM1838043.1 metal-dependent hydrolase [Pseudosulfitobacter pseudonitzschiae]MBM1843304.1 metal-dependent hydrolase [Pseudosulfitobacter pseudonitzschiae]MBM1848170.1 metal-dependent hydrolase [Pseudosulfitobacter pseudonitzschiae]
MFVAHLPAAYLAVRAIRPDASRTVMAAILAGSVLPDLDLLWFYLVDARQHHHHDYLTHKPLVWALLALAGWARGSAIAVGVAAGALLHMMLDSIAGQITWGWPFTTLAATLVVVPATRDWWLASFLLHWTIAVELMICTAASVVWFVSGKRI